MPLQLNQKSWNDPKKIAARRETIIDQYRNFLGWQVPEDRQYWSMCGQCATKGKDFQEGCEPHQLISEGFIKPKQFHGVDINPEITDANRISFPQANWYVGDFYRMMEEAKAYGRFNPAVVNVDFINMPDRACGYFADIMAFLSACRGSMMVISNMILSYQRFQDRSRDIEFAVKRLNKSPQFQFALSKCDWNFNNKYYRYAGTGKESRTTMGSLVFWKDE